MWLDLSKMKYIGFVEIQPGDDFAFAKLVISQKLKYPVL